MNITDHVTRLNLPVQRSNATIERTKRAVGCLLGQQTGKTVEIHTSFELDFEVKGDHAFIDTAFMAERMEAFTKTFPDFGVLGWYTTSTLITPNDLSVTHKQVCQTAGIEDCLVLVMDANPARGLKHLPMWTFESHHTTNESNAEYCLKKIPFSVELEEIEQIVSAMRENTDSRNKTAHFSSALSKIPLPKVASSLLSSLQKRLHYCSSSTQNTNISSKTARKEKPENKLEDRVETLVSWAAAYSYLLYLMSESE